MFTDNDDDEKTLRDHSADMHTAQDSTGQDRTVVHTRQPPSPVPVCMRRRHPCSSRRSGVLDVKARSTSADRQRKRRYLPYRYHHRAVEADVDSV
jgi:hypothetical protein